MTDSIPLTLDGIAAAIRASWSADTCSPDDVARSPWHPDNPAWGHCDITALIVNDLLGGPLICAKVFRDGDQQGYHWWNRLPSGIEIDLTREQFRDGQLLTPDRVVERPPGKLKYRWEEYLLLRERVAARLGPLPSPR
jgi:hypothetical protein